jgi:tetratricopeptide (TPR) repeat protein
MNWFRSFLGNRSKPGPGPIRETKTGPAGNESGDLESLLAQALSAIKDQRTEEGKALYSKALKLNPKAADTIYNSAVFLHNGATELNRRAGGATRFYKAGLGELDASRILLELIAKPPYEGADIWAVLGCVYQNLGKFDQAFYAHKRATELDPDGPDACDAHFELGMLYWHKGQGSLGRTETNTGKIYAFDPMSQEFNDAENHFLKAISVGWKAVKKDPNCRDRIINAHRLLRDIYTNRFEGTKAVEHCLELYKMKPDDSDAIEWLRQAEKNTGKKFL